jgi:hypothetical protein
MANDTEYGLAAYFYTRDLRRAWTIAEQLEYGMVRQLRSSSNGLCSSSSSSSTVLRHCVVVCMHAKFLVESGLVMQQQQCSLR